MHLLVSAATEMEIEPTISWLRTHQKNDVQILITGVGLPSATYAFTKAFTTSRPRLVIQAGVAGTLDNNVVPGTTVAVRNECIGDLGVDENGFRSVFDMQLENPDLFPWKNGKLCNDHELLQQSKLPVVDGVTVNEVSTSPARIEYYRTRWGATVESMEGAALHFVALQEKIPFLQIRALSNFAGERDKSKWMMQQAITSLNTELQTLLTKLSS